MTPVPEFVHWPAEVAASVFTLAGHFVDSYHGDCVMPPALRRGLNFWYAGVWVADELLERRRLSPAAMMFALAQTDTLADPGMAEHACSIRELLLASSKHLREGGVPGFMALALEVETARYARAQRQHLGGLAHDSLESYLRHRLGDSGMTWAMHGLVAVHYVQHGSRVPRSVTILDELPAVVELCALQSALLNDLFDVDRDERGGQDNAVLVVERTRHVSRRAAYHAVAELHDRHVSRLEGWKRRHPGHWLCAVIDAHLGGFNAFLLGAQRYVVGRRALEQALDCAIEAPETRSVAVSGEFLPCAGGDAKTRCRAA